MKQTLRRILALVLSFLMVVTGSPMNAFAEVVSGAQTDTSGTFSLRSVQDYTYTFHATFKNEDGSIVAEQYVFEGSTLNQPASPTKADHKFMGWYYGEGNTTKLDFSAPVTLATDENGNKKDTHVTYTAKFEPVYYVFFHDVEGEQTQSRVIATLEGVSGQELSFESVPAPVLTGDQVHLGWKLDGSGDTVNKVTLGNEDLHFYPDVQSGHWLVFDSGAGATYLEPVFVKPSASTVAPDSPSRPGYTFQYWTTTVNENGEGEGEKYTFGGTLSSHVTLYAVWNPNDETPYLVVHLLENANDDKYSYKESETLYGVTGAGTNAQAKSYEGFEVEDIKQGIIAGDGSTVVEIKYERIEYTIYFYTTNKAERVIACGKIAHTHSTGWWDSCYDRSGNLTCGLEEHTHSNDCYKTYEGGLIATIKAKHGADITDLWPLYNNSSRWSTKTNGGGPWQNSIDVMPIGGATYHAPSDSSTYLREVEYYVSVLPGETAEVTQNGVGYKIHHIDKSYGSDSSTVSEDDRYPIAGFAINNELSSAVGFKPYADAQFFYDRLPYDIIFNNGAEKPDKVISKLFEESIVGVDYTPDPPAAKAKGYSFVGWYDNPAGAGDKYAFAGTMPADDITVYAVWELEVYNATVYLTMEGLDEDPKVIKVTYGTSIDEDELPIPQVPEGYTFHGWSKTPNSYTPFNFSTKLEDNISLYPYYTKNGAFTVSYAVSAGTAPVDSGLYADGSYAEALTPDTLEYNADGKTMVFVYWKDAKGNTYAPRDKVAIHDNVTLTAVYAEKEATVELVYNSNYPNGTNTTDKVGLYINQPHNVLDNMFEVPYGYEFIGWKDENGNDVSVGAKISLDNAENNHLYAQWKQSIASYQIYHYLVGTSTPVAQTESGSMAIGETLYGHKATVFNAGYESVQFAYYSQNSVVITEDEANNVIIAYYNIPLTITAGSKTKTYDGTPLTDGSYSITSGQLLSGDTITIAMTADSTITQVGEKANKIDQANSKIPGYYAVTFVDGKLTVSKKDLTITAASDKKVYDGTALIANSYTDTGIASGDSLNVTISGSQTDVGKSDNVVSSVTITKNGVDVTDCYNIKTEKGSLEVTPATLTITTPNASKTYDGSALTAEGTITGFVNGETATFTTTGSQTEVGYSANSYSLVWNGTAKQGNYTISESIGTLTVSEYDGQITVTTTGGTFTYDGQAHGATVSVSALPNGYTLETATSSATATDVTAEAVKATCDTLVIKNAAGKDVTGELNINYVDGTIVINPAPLTIKTESASKVYDGTTLTAPGAISGFVNGETATFTVTGTQTAVGNSENTYSLAWDGTAKATNYTISSEDIGTLVVTESANEIVVTTTGGTFVYDGQAHGATVSVSTLPNGYTLETATSNATATDVTADAVKATCDSLVIKNAAGENVTSKLNITYVDGTIVITKRPVTLTSATDTKVYDGTPLTNDEVTVGGDGFVEGEGATYNVTGSQTEEGSSNNTFSYTLNSNTKAGNYDITPVEGILTVTPVTSKVTVTILENSGTATYDGTAHTVTGYEVVSISNPLYTKADFTFATGNDSVSGTDAGSYPMLLTPEHFTNISENFETVEFIIQDGTLEIAKRNVTLTSETASKVYDGSALTRPEVTVSGDGFVSGEVSDIKATGTITNVGSVTNTITYTLGSAFKDDNYVITKNEGTLTVTALTEKVTVTITENSGEAKYDGAKHEVDGYFVTNISNTLYTAADFTFSGEDHIEGIDAGSYPMLLEPTDFTNISKNFTVVEFVIVDGTLEIAKRNVTLTSGDATGIYNGQPLTNSDITTSGDGWATGEGATCNVTGSQTEVGSSPNSFTYTLMEGTKADNYNITTVPGTLTVTALTDEVIVTITENSGTEKYDGSEKTVTGYTVTSISNDLYKVSDFSFSGDATVKGIDAGVYAMNLKPEDFTNNSKNITNVKFVIVDGTLEITKRTVTMTSASQEKVYDGKALTNDTVTVTGDGWASGEGATYSVTGSQTAKGESPNAFTYKLNANTKAENYDITKVEGTLKVTDLTDKVTVTITENRGTEKYDGTEKTVEGYTVSISNSLYTVNDFVFKGNDTVTGTDAGTYEMLLKPADFENKSANFTNVEFVIKDGTLVITKRVVTLTSATKEKVYDGTPLTDNNVTVGGEGFATGEGATYDVTGSQTEVGESKNTFTYTLNEGTKADNYTITTEAGTLKVTPVTEKVTVTITENSGKEKYDGTEKTVTGYKVTNISNSLYTEKDFEFKGDATVKGTDAGTYDMLLKPEDFNNISKNFSNVEFVIVNGTLEITKREVTLTSATDSREYNGNALTNGNVTVGGEGFADGEGATWNVTGSQTLVGSSENKFTYTLNEGTKAGNYDIKTVFGTLTVTDRTAKYEITVEANSGEYLYDGKEHTAEGFKTLTFTVEGNTYTVEGLTARVTKTNAGEYVNEITGTAVVKDANGNDVTAQFIVNETDGKLVINKRTVTMTSADAEKTYDGKPLTKDEVNESGDGFVSGEGATYDVKGSQTAVGESPNTFTYTLKEGTKAENYIITPVEGTLKVTEFNGKVVVTITENKGTYKYDGTEKKVENYTVSINTTLYTEADFVFNGSALVTGTDAGTYNMELKPENFDNISKNFKDEDVTFVIEDGTLVIEKRVVTLTSADGEKVYDGTALTNDNVTVTGDGFADKEGATYDVTGTITNVGSTENTFTYTLNESTKADNYTITTEEGMLTVTPVTETVTVTITENSGTKKYDGTEKTVTGYKVTSISNDLYTEADFEFKGDATVKGTDAGTYDMLLKPEDFNNISKNFSNVEFKIVDGTLVIEKRVVTLTSADDEQVYNGKALTNDTVTVTGDGFADGEGATCDVTGTITNVGSTKNTFTYTLNDGTKAGNYTITTKEGTLTVTPVTDKVTVTITENSGTEKYDGSEKTVTDYKVTSISNDLYTEADFTFSGDATIKGTDAGTYDMLLKPENFKNISENFTDVVFEIVDGKLEITKRNVTLTSATDDKMYDGKALTNSTVSVTGDGFVGSEGATYDVTGTQTEVGESKNAFTYELKEGTLAGNYDIDVVFGTLTVTELTDEVVVTITEHSGSYTYDGTEKTVTGYDVKIDNPLYFETDFTFTGDATIKGTEAGSYPMELIPANFTNKSDNFSKVTFKIVHGTLEIARKAITVTADSDNKIYDGTALTDEGYTSTAIAEGDKFASVTVEGSQLNVGSSKNVASDAKIVDENGKDVTASYDISYVEGTLTVNQKAITITADSGSKEYDGTALVVNSYKGSDLAEGDAYVSVTVTGSQTKVGSSENIPSAAKIINAANEDVTANYDISYVNGTLTVTQTTKELKVVANSHEWFYDGTAHADGGYTVYYGGKSYAVEAGKSVKIETGDTVTATITKTVTNVDDTAEGNNEIVELVVENADQYAKITEVAGTLTIKPIDVVVTIKGNNDTAVYDGKVHTVTGYTATANTGLYNVEKDFTFSGDATASRTEVGTTIMGLKPDQFKNINTNFANVTFQVSDGYQSITPIDVVVITIVGNNNTTDYDGEEHSVSGYEVTINNPLYKEADFIFKAEAEAVRTDAGTTMMGLNADQFENINKNFKKVTFNVTDGYQTINPINVTVTITEHSDKVDYDGKEHTVEGYDVKIENTLYTEEDFTFSGTDSVSGTNAGTYDMELKSGDFTNTNKNFANVTFVIVDGQLVIDPIDVTVTITEHSGEVDYDSKKHTVTGYDVEIKNPLYTEEDFTFSGNDSVSGTNAGTYDMELTEDDFANTNDNFADVTFVIVDGQLVINKINATVTIVGASNTTVYDGTEHKVEGYEATASTALYDVTKDFTFNGTAEAARKNVGTVDMGLAADQFANINPNFDTVTFVVTDGSQTITKKPLTITADSNEKQYDGTALTDDGYTSTELAEDDAFESVKVVGSIIFEGTVPNVASDAVIMDGEEDVTANYDIKYVDGTLEIFQSTKELKVVANSETWTYDSENHSNGGYTVTYGDEIYTVAAGESAKLSTGDKVTATIDKVVKNVADTEPGNNKIVMLVIENAEQYANVETENGTLTIEPLEITFTAASDSKEYDGTPLTNNGFTPTTIDNGDKIESVTVTGSITEVGEVDNVPSAAVIMDGTEDVTDNYTIKYVNGVLEILPSSDSLVVTANSNSWQYDSEYHADGGYTVTYKGETITVAAGESATLSTGDKVTATITAKVKNVADSIEDNNVIVELVVENEGQYASIVKVPGKLSITEKPLTITAEDAEKEYDGTALTKNAYTATALAEGDSFKSVTITGSITNVGTKPNVPSAAVIMDGEEDVTANYAITYENGELKITKTTKELKVVANSNSWMYDSENHADGGYTVTYDGKTYDVKAGESATLTTGDMVTATITKTVKNVADTAEGNNKIVELVIENADQYANVTEVAGTLTITQRPLTITADSNEKLYDGTALTDDGFTADGLATGDEATSAKVEGSQTLVGSSMNEASDAVVMDGTEEVTANYDIKYVDGTLTVTEPNNHSLVIVKTHAGRKYMVGEKVEFVITVKNIFADARTITITEIKGVTITGESVFEAVAPDAVVKTTAEYVITDKDVIALGFTNTAYAKFEGSDKIYEAKDTVETVEPTSDLSVTKTEISKPADENGYALGETVKYELVVRNNANLTINDIVLVDKLVEFEKTIGTLKMGQSSETFTVEYVVTSDDILSGRIINTADVTGTASNGKDLSDTDEVTVVTADVDPGMIINKVSDVKDGETVSLGDVITYTITVTNTGNVPYTNVVVKDDMTKAEWTIEVLEVGETETFTTTYTVTSDDILAGTIVNEVTAKGDPIPDPKDPTDPKNPEGGDDEKDEPDDVDATLSVTKTSDVKDGKTVSLGDVITYTIVVKNEGNVPFYGVEVVDKIDGAEFVPGAAYQIDANGNAVIKKLAVGTAVTLTAKYTVTSDDILNGSILNEVTATADPIDDPKNPDTPKVPSDDDDVEDETDDVNAALSVVKSSDVAEGEKVALGETINYTIVVKNEGNVPYYNVVVTDEWTDDEWTIEVLAVGEEVTFKTSYTVTSDDILAGIVVNEVTAKADPIDDPKNPEKPVTPEDDDKIEDETDDVNAKISVVKTSDVEEGEKVALGETITYTIVVKNEGNVPYYNVVVTDEWTDDVWTIEVLAVGESKTFTTTYVVTSDDILAGKVVNEVTVEADDIDDPKNPDEPKKPEDDDDEEDETDDVDYELEVIKTSDVKEGETVGLGETITYTIQVTNKGNVPYYNVKVVDEWTNDEWTIDELAVGETKTFTTSYVVKESDLIKGTVLNEVTVKADPIDDPKNPDEPKTPEDEDDIEDPTDATKPSLFIEKKTVSTPANGESYALGETISYEITVLNNGNLTITDIVVTDELTGDTWTIAKLEVGEMSAVLKTSYVVTEADILAGSVLNVATATGKTEDPENPKPTVTPGDIEDPTDEPDPDFDLEKTLINLPEKGYFTVGEKAVYEIVVKNVGNLTLTDIVVTEDLMDAVFVSANDARATVNGATATISELKPGEAVTLTAEYVVKIEDLSTDLRNFISGSGNGPVDPEEDDDNEVTPVDDLVVVAGSKIWDDVDNAYGTRPESITVRLYADNVEIRQAVVTEADGWKFSFDMLPKHNTDGTEILYYVSEDAIIGYNTEYALDSYDITNSLTEHVLTIRYWYYEIGGEVAAETHESIRKYGEPYDVESPYVIGHSPDAVSIAGIITEDVSYDVIYTRNKYKIVIEYMYLDGTYVWPRITETLYYEDPYEFWTPELEGYTPNYQLIKGNMPHYDLYFKVIYVPEETDIIIDEYGVPLGVGTVEMNVGDCFE